MNVSTTLTAERAIISSLSVVGPISVAPVGVSQLSNGSVIVETPFFNVSSYIFLSYSNFSPTPPIISKTGRLFSARVGIFRFRIFSSNDFDNSFVNWMIFNRI
jgi:hypothetical protein